MRTSRRTTATHAVQARIKTYILDHRMAPGDSMPSELELCQELGVSRSSVREAIRQLGALDIVEVRHGLGTFVGNLSLAPLVDSLSFRCLLDPREAHAALREIIEVRCALDLGQSSVVVESLRGSFDPRLHELVDTMVTRSAEGLGFTEADREFHGLLLRRSTENRLMSNLIDAFWDIHSDLLGHSELPTPEDITDTAAAHGAMLRAAEEGDVQAYHQAVQAHYRPLIRVLDRAHPEAQPNGATAGHQTSAVG